MVEESLDPAISDIQSASIHVFNQTIEDNTNNNVSNAGASISRAQSIEISMRSADPEDELPNQLSPAQSPRNIQDASSADMTPDQALEAALQEATAQADVLSSVGSVSDVEMTDSFAHDPAVLAPTSNEGSTGSSLHDNGLIESSEEPMDVADGESDPYEPPEATPSPAAAHSSPVSPPFSPAPPEAISGSSRINRQHDGILTGSDEVTDSKAMIRADDLALPPALANQVFSSTLDTSLVGWLTDEQDGSTLASRKTFYTPYESPLKNFRAFRFHPGFEQEVEGGFKSITYSNNIKVDKELCRYELAGGVCNDASCEFQHFKDMGLAGAFGLREGISHF